MDKDRIKEIVESMGLTINFEEPVGILNGQTKEFTSIDEIFPEFAQLNSRKARDNDVGQEIKLNFTSTDLE